jgi:hypothetical protein
MSKQKNSFTTYPAAETAVKPRILEAIVSGALAEPLPQRERRPELDPPTGDAVSYPQLF